MSYIDDLNDAASRAQDAADTAEGASQILFDVANGDSVSTVTTASGEVKTVAKAIADIEASFEGGLFNSTVEEVTLADGQTVVTLTNATTDSMQLYVEGAREFDFEITGTDSFELSESFPSGTRIWVVSSEIYADVTTTLVEDSKGTSRTLASWVDGVQYTYETVSEMQADETLSIGSKVATRGFSEAGVGGASYEIVAGSTGTDGYVDLAGSGLQARLLDPVSAEQFGGATADMAPQLLEALRYTSSERISISGDATVTLSSADVDFFLSNINRVAPEVSLLVSLPDEEITISGDKVISSLDCQNITLNGADYSAASIISLGAVTGTAKDWSVEINVSSATDFKVGGYAVILQNVVTGDARARELGGCWRVESVGASSITVRHHHYQSSFPTSSVTGGTVYPVNTVLRWDAGTRGLAFSGGSLAQVSRLVIAQQFDPATDSPSDGEEDGVQIGTEPVGQAIHAGSTYMLRVGVVEWPNNGIQNQGGNLVASGLCCNSNGHRGAQAAANGTIYAKFGSYNANGSSGVESEGSGFFNAAGSVASGNGGQGVYSINGLVVFNSGAMAYGNITNGVDARNGGQVNIDTAFSRYNGSNGVYCDGGHIAHGGGGQCNDNGVNQYRSLVGGVIDASGSSVPSGPNLYNIDTDNGALMILPDSNMLRPAYTRIQSEPNANGYEWITTSLPDLIIRSLTDEGATSTNVLRIKANGSIIPEVDGVSGLGSTPSNRFSQLSAVDDTINTSDVREKQQISDLTDAELRVGAKLKVRRFKWNHAVAEKGEDAARWHIGFIAQEVVEAFEGEGLDPYSYGAVCHDVWEGRDEELDSEGRVILPAREAGDRYGIRISELEALMLASRL